MAAMNFWETYLQLAGFAYFIVAVYLLLQSVEGFLGWLKKDDAPLVVKIVSTVLGTVVYFFTWPVWLIGTTLAAQKILKDGEIE